MILMIISAKRIRYRKPKGRNDNGQDVEFTAACLFLCQADSIKQAACKKRISGWKQAVGKKHGK